MRKVTLVGDFMVVGRALAQHVRGVAELKSPRGAHAAEPWREYHEHAAAAAKSFQSCPTLRDSIDGSPPGSPVPGILQARTLEWVAISFSNAGK